MHRRAVCGERKTRQFLTSGRVGRQLQQTHVNITARCLCKCGETSSYTEKLSRDGSADDVRNVGREDVHSRLDVCEDLYSKQGIVRILRKTNVTRYICRLAFSRASLNSTATSHAFSMTRHSSSESNLPREIEAVMLTPKPCLPPRGVLGFVRSSAFPMDLTALI